MQTPEIVESVGAHLARAAGVPVEVRSILPLGGGACQDNYRVVATMGGEEKTFVLRSDAVRSLAGSINRSVESQVINAAADAGVKTPRARWLADGLVRPGAHAYFMDWIPGESIGRRVVRDESLAAARVGLAGEAATELAKIHSIRPGAVALELLVPADPIASSLDAIRAAIDTLSGPRLALELALHWLVDHPPRDREVTLVHGDFRTGNLLVGPGGLNAILDWEFSHWGCPAEDMAWLCLRNWRFGQNAKGAGGFATRGELYDAYGRASGRPVDASDVHYWEVLGNVRWAAGSVQQGERYLQGGETDLELIAIPRRAAEMEFEALRLIDRGRI